MTPERWQKIRRVLEAAVELSPGQREAFLIAAAKEDPEIRGEVDSLLALDRSGSFLDFNAIREVFDRDGLSESSSPQDESAFPGLTVGHYEILRKLGEGGMGQVYLARDQRLGREVAVKLLPPQLAENCERLSRFVREAKAASALNHPNIVSIYDMGREQIQSVERDFLVMEFVKGRSLDDILSGQPLLPERVIDIGAQIASALAAAHEEGIVHRDVKPANLMVTDKGQVKVLDFGIAKLVDRGESSDSMPTRTAGLRTEEGAILGTAAYMSPEQAEGCRWMRGPTSFR